MNVLFQFLGFFFFMLTLGYIAPSGFYYWAYHVRNFKDKELLRIQPRLPKPGQISREIKLSIISIFIFSVMSTGVLQLYLHGHTNIYLWARDYPVYFPVSIALCLVLHDTYFYWTHRLMHWQPLFKYVHLGHHRSITPTPWAIYAFQPAEAITQFIGICLLLIFLPVCPLAFLGFLFLDTQMNAGGHTGFEFIPKSISEHPLLKVCNTVTHHDSHHTNMSKNFGSFFNFWDRWMGTFLDAKTPSDDKLNGRHVNVEEPHLLDEPKFLQHGGNLAHDSDLQRQ